MKPEPLFNEWTRKGKKYKTKYFAALKELYADMDAKKEEKAARTTGTDQIHHVAEKRRL